MKKQNTSPTIEFDAITNLVPHAVHIYNRERQLLAVIPPTGCVLRCQPTYKELPSLTLPDPSGNPVKVPLYQREFLSVNWENLPDAVLVSALVGRVLAETPYTGRIFTPGDLLRDAEGNVIGTIGLVEIV